MTIQTTNWREPDDLPEDDRLVLLRLEDDTYPLMLGYYGENRWGLDDEACIDPEDIIGWMELETATDLLDGP